MFEGESPEYRAARDKLVAAEAQLRNQIEAVATLRRELPLGREADDYAFEGTGGTVRLSELFEDGKDTLLIYSYMYGDDMAQPCPMCTTYLDGADGYAPHIRQRMNFVIAAQASVADLEAIATARGWRNHQFVSAANNTYADDYKTRMPNGAQIPMANVFVKRDGKIYHYWSTELFFQPSDFHPRHVDMLWPLWHYFDLSPEGRGDFMPRLSYE